MKKLIRQILAILCVFFAFRVLRIGSVPVLRSLGDRIAESASEATLLLARQIDALTGKSPDGADMEDGKGVSDSGADMEDGKGVSDSGAEKGVLPDQNQNQDQAQGEAQGQDQAQAQGEAQGQDQAQTQGEAQGQDQAQTQGQEEGTGTGGFNKTGTDREADAAADTGEGDGSGAQARHETPAAQDIPGMDVVLGEGDDASLEPSGGAAVSPAEESAEGGAQSSASAGSSEAGSAPPLAGDDEIFYYYYTRISREERLLYDAMLALSMGAREGEYTEESRLISLNPSGEEFAQSYTRAYNALVTDHPELFWIAQGKSHFECRYYVLPSFGGQFKVILSLPDPYGPHPEEQQELENAADALLAKVDFTLSDARIALQIHDLLIDAAWYNTQAGEDDYAHTAYGALVKDSAGNPGGALCDGYAMAYEYLLQRAGIPCTMVCGYAGESDEKNEKHAWNVICLEDEWYEVDATWDDLDFFLSPYDDGYDLLVEALSDDEYMSRIRHSMWCLTTQQIRYFTPGDEYRYVSDSGWVTLLQPSVHIRFSSSESEQTRDYVTPLAPAAEGTWYSWETVREE